MKSLQGESAELVLQLIDGVLHSHGLRFENLVSFCADYAPVNLGCPTLISQRINREKEVNIFKRLQERKKNIIPIGCPAHILHNAAEKSADRLTIDIESIVFKLASFFKGSTRRHEMLKDFCEFLEVNYSTLPSHGPTRWLTLLKVLERMLQLWDPLTAIFTSTNKPPRMLEEFFKSNESLIVVNFLKSVMSMFERPLLLLQRAKLLLPELVNIMSAFQFQIQDRRSRQFYGALTATLLQRADVGQKLILESSFDEFFSTANEYIDKWFRLECLPTNIQWILLRERNGDYAEMKELAKQIAPEIAEKDGLFDEVSDLNRVLQQLPVEIVSEDNAESKWLRIFKENNSMPCLYKLISIVIAIPVSNSFIEHVFSLCRAQWTDQRDSLNEETVKALLQVRVNFDEDCSQMYNMLMDNPDLRKKIRENKKYE